MDKSIFTTRFKECCKKKGYTQQYVADKLNISIDGLKHHLRKKNPNFPPLDLLINMADILDVDIGYLIGEINYERYGMQKISDVTGLNPNSIKYISKDSRNYSPDFVHLVNNFATSPYIDILEKLFLDYEEICTTQMNKPIYIEHSGYKRNYFIHDIKDLAKSKILSIMNEMLDESPFYFTTINTEQENKKIADEMAIDLLNMIEYEKNKYPFDYDSLLKKVEYQLEEINKVYFTSWITLYSPHQIIFDCNEKLKKIYNMLP